MAEAQADDPFAHTRMTLGEHLGELRKRLFRGVVAVTITFVVALYYGDELTELLLEPYRQTVARLNEHNVGRARAAVEGRPELKAEYFLPDGTYRFLIDDRLRTLSPTESMWFVLKVALYFALLFGSPVLLWQLWQFVAAGLYKRERRWVRYFFPPAVLLFAAGALFSYSLLVPYGMYYTMQSVPIELVQPELTLAEFFSFLSTLSLGMGLVCQLPLLMTFLGLAGIVPAGTFASLRGYSIVAAFAVAALLTPGPDVFSQIAVAGPMIVLYELGILGARLASRRATRSAA